MAVRMASTPLRAAWRLAVVLVVALACSNDHPGTPEGAVERLVSAARTGDRAATTEAPSPRCGAGVT